MQSVNLKVYGTFSFQGLEKSPLAGALNLMDLVSFRELYGFLTAERAQEIAALQGRPPAPRRSRARTPRRSCSATKAAEPRPTLPVGPHHHRRGHARASNPTRPWPGWPARLRREELATRVYDPKELERGRGAQRRGHPERPERSWSETIAAIEAAGETKGLPSRRSPGRRPPASSASSSTLSAHRAQHRRADHLRGGAGDHQQRAGDGDPRAGAGDRHAARRGGPAPLHPGHAGDRGGGDRGVFGALGAGRGRAAWWRSWDRWASRRPTTCSPSSSRARGCTPRWAPPTWSSALVIVLVVSAVSSFYPAWLAMRVTPRQAMQTEE